MNCVAISKNEKIVVHEFFDILTQFTQISVTSPAVLFHCGDFRFWIVDESDVFDQKK